MKFRNLLITIMFTTASIFSFGQSNWYQQTFSEYGIQVSFPGKPTDKSTPNTPTKIFLYEADGSNFILMISSFEETTDEDIHTERIINGIENTLTNFNKEDLISTTKIYYDNKKAVDFYFKKYLYGTLVYHRARGIQLNSETLIILFYTYTDYNSNHKETFFNSFKSIKVQQVFTSVDEHKKSRYDPNESLFYDPSLEFLSGYTINYVCDGTGKSRGLKFSIRYPESWKSEEGDRPHIVKKFSNSDMSVQAMALVNELENIPSKEDSDYFFTTKNAKDMIPKGGHYIKSNKTVIDGLPALVIDYSYQREKLGTIFKGKMRMYSIIYKSYLLQIQFGVSQEAQITPIDIEKKFKEYELLFNSMINSLIVTSKWEKD